MQKIGIGYENYKRMMDDNCYYADKTLFIRDIVDKGGMVTLFTRPRRFGKTLTLSMLRTFFEKEYDQAGNVIDNSHYFAGKKIMEEDDRILSMMGQYPVIKLSFKSAKQPDYVTAFKKIRDEIIGEFRRHAYLRESDRLFLEEKDELIALSRPAGDRDLEDRNRLVEEIGRYATSLKTLSTCLAKHHDHNVIILLDEYDVPLENAYYEGFYKEMTDFIRSLFESCLKSNDALQFAVVTGCLRISRESIFTGLNHLKMNSVRDDSFSEGFGFTPEETDEMLSAYGIEDKAEEIREWYDGYVFGRSRIYNPWSVVSYVDSIVNEHKLYPEPYWANTSSNQIVKDMIWHADADMREELDVLINGGTIEKKIHEDITYNDIHESEDNLWNFLFFTGYMRKVSERMMGNDIYLTMRIPNREIASIYSNQISSWFDQLVKEEDRTQLYQAVLSGDTDTAQNYVSELLEKSISTFDSDEAFYHGFFLSLLYGLPRYSVRSNREEGDGRPDIILYPNRPKDPAILFEIKTRKMFSQMDDGLEEAYRQIRDRQYEKGIINDGYTGAVSYGICFCKKSCIIGKCIP